MDNFHFQQLVTKMNKGIRKKARALQHRLRYGNLAESERDQVLAELSTLVKFRPVAV